jgi:hypothetical protein
MCSLSPLSTSLLSLLLLEYFISIVILTMPTKKDPNPRDKEGAIVHALTKWALGEHTAKNIVGNVDYNKMFIQGTIVNVFDGCKPNGKNAVWVLRVNFMLPSDDPIGTVELKRVEIHRQHCIPGPVPARNNPPCRTTFMDSVGDPNHAVKGSRTYLPNADGRAADAAATEEAAATYTAPRVLLSPDPLVAATAGDKEIEVVMMPTTPALPPMEHDRAAEKAKKKRMKAAPSEATHDDASTAMPPPSTTKKEESPRARRPSRYANVDKDDQRCESSCCGNCPLAEVGCR